jgi:hypothetical protein
LCKFNYTAGGGNGNYAFNYAQTILSASVMGVYQNGTPLSAGNARAGTQDRTYFQQSGNTATLVDIPGVPLQTAGSLFHKPSLLQSASVTFKFETDAIVTDGSQLAVCPTVFWTFTLTYSAGGVQQSNVSYTISGGQQ